MTAHGASEGPRNVDGPETDWSHLPELYAQRRAAGYAIVVLSLIVGVAWTLWQGGDTWTHILIVAILPPTWWVSWKLAKAVRASGLFR